MKEIIELEKAIEHCKEVQNKNCTNKKCKLEHKQLELWLTELLTIKKAYLFAQSAMET